MGEISCRRNLVSASFQSLLAMRSPMRWIVEVERTKDPEDIHLVSLLRAGAGYGGNKRRTQVRCVCAGGKWSSLECFWYVESRK